ncbi:hypothetical protein C8J56DRAFT_930840, partial [Mycena floridula]
MSMWANIIGFSFFGLAARLGQLGIQQRNLFSNPAGHVISMGVFGYGGYWAWRWDIKSAALIEQKREEIEQRRRIRQEKAEATEARLMGASS